MCICVSRIWKKKKKKIAIEKYRKRDLEKSHDLTLEIDKR